MNYLLHDTIVFGYVRFTKLNAYLKGFLQTCLMDSTIVTVLPVPGGPKRTYGAGRDVPETMW